MSKLRVVLLWHMHQPDYRDPTTGSYQLPWTYLHALKDYVDMAAHLEANPKARAVVNFVPILLEQIDDYVNQIKAFLRHEGALRDPLLSALVEQVMPSSIDERHQLLNACLRANRERMIKPFPAYERLVHMASWLQDNPDAMVYLDEQYLADLVVWYHLTWMAETVRRDDRRIRRLMKKESLYSLEDRRELLQIIGELLEGIAPRYRRLAENGQVELSVTPYAHPIMPLLLDIKSACEAMPDVLLPHLTQYPGGESRSRWHIKEGLDLFEKHFGFRPKGCWPAEGSVSDAALELLREAGFAWAATGESVLRNSLKQAKMDVAKLGCIHRPYTVGDKGMHCFFRDDGLSDLIGFRYADWHADDAVANLVHHLENIGQACGAVEDAVVSIILDGENAWEYYPNNGYYFLNGLYEALTEHEGIELCTYQEILATKPKGIALPGVVAGSWVYGTFSTWIGEPDKNKGWDMLGDAKKVFDRVMAGDRLSPERRLQAERQMAVCEGSDWFWWFGDYNDAVSVSDFERLYRLQLSRLYHLLDEKPPEYLSHVFTHGKGTPAMGGAMRPGREPT